MKLKKQIKVLHIRLEGTNARERRYVGCERWRERARGERERERERERRRRRRCHGMRIGAGREEERPRGRGFSFPFSFLILSLLTGRSLLDTPDDQLDDAELAEKKRQKIKADAKKGTLHIHTHTHTRTHARTFLSCFFFLAQPRQPFHFLLSLSLAQFSPLLVGSHAACDYLSSH